MNTDSRTPDYRFAIGMVAGAALSTGLMMWLAPRMTREVRQRVANSATALGERAAEQYRQVGGRVGAAVEDVARKGQVLRDDVADVVARGALEVERFATAAKTAPAARQL